MPDMDSSPIDGYEHDHETLAADDKPVARVCIFRPAEPQNAVTDPPECMSGCCNKIPCDLCKGDSAVMIGQGTDRRRMTSQEWCMEMDTCAAMIDWEKVFGDC